MKTLNEIFGLTDSWEIDGATVRRGDLVRVKRTGQTGRVMDIGKSGLMTITSGWGVWFPEQLEVVATLEKEDAAWKAAI